MLIGRSLIVEHLWYVNQEVLYMHSISKHLDLQQLLGCFEACLLFFCSSAICALSVLCPVLLRMKWNKIAFNDTSFSNLILLLFPFASSVFGSIKSQKDNTDLKLLNNKLFKLRILELQLVLLSVFLSSQNFIASNLLVGACL